MINPNMPGMMGTPYHTRGMRRKLLPGGATPPTAAATTGTPTSSPSIGPSPSVVNNVGSTGASTSSTNYNSPTTVGPSSSVVDNAVNNSMFGSKSLANDYYNTNPTATRNDTNSWSWQGKNRVYTPFKYGVEHPTGNTNFDESMQNMYAGMPAYMKPPTTVGPSGSVVSNNILKKNSAGTLQYDPDYDPMNPNNKLNMMK